VKAWLAVLLALASVAMPAAAGTRVWTGRIGDARVVVELSDDGAQVFGRYFYERHGRDLQLEGTRDGARLSLREHESYETTPDDPEWTLDASRPDVLVGNWRRADGRRLPVRLTPARTAAQDPERAELARRDPYAALRVAGRRLRPGREQAVGPYRLLWQVEPVSGVELFRVVAGYDGPTRARLNRLLAQRHWAEIANAAECQGLPHGDYAVRTTLRRIAPTLLSVSVFVSYSCGGAHPDFGDVPLNLDPRTGRDLALEDVLWLGTGTPPRIGGASESAFFEYRQAVLAPWLAEAMARHHPRRIAGDGESEGCDYTDPEVWSLPSWYATDAGLYLGPSFPRVARACEYPEWTLLPWHEVRAHPGAVRIAP
jgi:hypothetical protein